MALEEREFSLMILSRAPITELMKTPSRTQTVKKTRAMTTALKERTEKVTVLNARLHGSPMSKASPSVSPFNTYFHGNAGLYDRREHLYHHYNLDL